MGKTTMIAVVAVIGSVAAIVTNLNSILSFGATWIVPRLEPYLFPRATIAVEVGSDVSAAPTVFIAEEKSQNVVIDSSAAGPGKRAILTVTAKALYKIAWQGSGVEAGAADQIFAGEGDSVYRLERKGDPIDGQVRLVLRQSDSQKSEPQAAEPTAALLLSAKALQATKDPGALVVSAVLPELDRALAILGLFETGTTDCARKLAWIRGGSQSRPWVGCLGMTTPGWLGDVITSLDGGDAHRLDQIVGEHATTLRSLAQNPRANVPDADLRQAMERLAASPEFWIQYQVRATAAYAEAADAARSLGLTSERGRLLLFDRLAQSGPGGVKRGISAYFDQFPEGSAARPSTEAARIAAVGDIFKAQTTPGLGSTRRVDTIVTGHGSIRGVGFDLDRLGVSETG
jgi:hypothetical protein